MKRRFSPALLVSLAVHTVVGLVIAQTLLIPTPLGRMLSRQKQVAIPAERISFLSIPRGNEPAVSGRSGGDGTPASSSPAPPLAAPLVVPDGIPPVVTPDRATPAAGSGPLISGGGPMRGVRPSFTDPRVWAPPGRILSVPKSTAQVIDEAIRADVGRITDSLMALGHRRAPGDWTIERDGRKWGIDQRAIRLGPVSIPTAVLALLPINIQANPVTGQRERQLNYMHSDIAFHAQRAINEDEFKNAVRNLRLRKERERASQQKEREPKAPAPEASPGN